MNSKPQLYSYFRSSCSYRVRIALYLKEIDFEYIPVHLIKNGGEHKSSEYTEKNPSGQVPCFIHKDQIINQSIAILNYINEVWSDTYKLFPSNPMEKSKVIEFCEIINSGIQPMQNMSLGQKLSKDHGFSGEDVAQFYVHWMEKGALILEKLLKKHSETYCFGNEITMADVCLIPQVYNFKRYKIKMNDFPNIERVYEKNLSHEAFQKASPEKQPDAPTT